MCGGQISLEYSAHATASAAAASSSSFSSSITDAVMESSPH